MNLKNYKLKYLAQDIPAGIITALVSIPISMGYASVAGLPVAYGLYGSVLPILIFGLLTSSPRFVFGIDAAPAALTGAMITSFGISPGSEEACSVIPVITLLTAIWLFLFFLIKAGNAVRFISQPVLGGFISGIGMTIILMQLPKLFGGTSGSGELPGLLIHIFECIRDSFNLFSLLMGIATIIILRICTAAVPKVPVSVLLMFAGALSEAIFHIHTVFGVNLLPAVKPGLPRLSLPDISLVSKYGTDIIFSSLPVALVILSESLLATDSIGNRYDDDINPSREISAYSAANLISAFSGCCPANGSISRTTIADQFGVKSQIMSVTASISMAVLLIFGTGFIKYLPVPVLTGIVISALISTLDFDLARKLRKCDRTECLIFWAAFASVLLLGTIYGVIIGVALSFLTFVIRSSDPPRVFMGIIPGRDGFYPVSGKNSTIPLKGVLIYRFSGSLFFANIDLLCSDIENALTPDTRVVIIDAGGIGSIDITASGRLVALYEKLKAKNIRFYMAGHVSQVNLQLRTFGADTLFMNGVVKQYVSGALAASGISKPYPLEYTKRSKNRYTYSYADVYKYADRTDILNTVPEYAAKGDANNHVTEYAAKYDTDGSDPEYAAGNDTDNLSHNHNVKSNTIDHDFNGETEAALEWAFGPDADEIINDIARRAAERLLDDNDDFSEDDLHDAAVRAASGYWNLVDEDAFLDILTSKLVSFVSEKKDMSDDDKMKKLSRLEKHIIERQIRIEKKLGEQDSHSLKYILRMREKVRDHVRRHHPDALCELDREHEEYREHLKEKEPELIKYLDSIKKKME